MVEYVNENKRDTYKSSSTLQLSYHSNKSFSKPSEGNQKMKTLISTPSLQQAVVNGDIASLKECFRSRVDTNMFDANGEPLLFTAIVNGDMETLVLLLSHSDVNLASEDGRTALMIAVEMNDMSMVKKLIKSGMSIENQYLFLSNTDAHICNFKK
mgnify:CR=1 FL=1